MRLFIATVAALATAAAASAHFVFIVPDAADPAKAIVVLSDGAEPDAGVSLAEIAPIKLTVRSAEGVKPLTHTSAADRLTVAVPGTGSRVVSGSVDYGITGHGGKTPALLRYHAKAVVGPPTAGGEPLAFEIVPETTAAGVRFRVLAGGKPVGDAPVSVTLPGGTKEKAIADTDGWTKRFTPPGRYALWTKRSEAAKGTHGDKPYTEIRHYATLVVDVAKK